MKEYKSKHHIDHKIEIEDVSGEFLVFIDGLPLGSKSGQAKFATAQAAYDAAEAAIARANHKR